MILTRGKIMSRKNDFERNKGEPFKKPNKTEFLRVSLAKSISMKGVLKSGIQFLIWHQMYPNYDMIYILFCIILNILTSLAIFKLIAVIYGQSDKFFLQGVLLAQDFNITNSD